MRRFNRILIVVFIILAGIAFVVSTWSHFLGTSTIGWAYAISALAIGYIPVAILGFRVRHTLLVVVAIPAAICLGLLSFSLVASIACWVLAGIARAFGVTLDPRLIGTGVFGITSLIVAYGLFNAARVRITRYTVALRNLPKGWENKTAVLVTDVHLGNIRSVGFARQIAARINALNPEIVFIGGDMFDGALVDLAACAEPWGTLKAPSGTFFVTGNHDEFSDSSKIIESLRKVGVRVLDNENVDVGGLQVVGVHDGDAHDGAKFREILTRSHIDRTRASILLNHQPSQLAIPEAAGISLQLSGHTHKGQFWPWSLLVSRVFGPFAYGLNTLRGLQVITSSGVGTWGPPMRVGTRSELVQIRFVAA